MDRLSAVSLASAGVEVLGGAVASPLLVGLIQRWKAHLQGRAGPSALQPYRDLSRLWGKSVVSVEGATWVYEVAPALVAATAALALAVVPASSEAPSLGLGHDFIVLVGLLAVARFASAAAAWDTSNGFALMGASRDLAVSSAAEAALLASFAVPGVLSATTDLAAMVARTTGAGPWDGAALPLGAAAFASTAVAELGRQPWDNPDTHLELTMIHEGPLLEYAGRDLAYLQWSVAARHWIFLVVGVELFLPHPGSAWLQLLLLPFELVAAGAALALTETLVAKMRILLAPRLLGVAAVAAVAGVAVRGVGR